MQNKKGFIKKQCINDHEACTENNADIRYVEYGKINEGEFEKIHYVSNEYAVDQIAECASDEKGKRETE